jgi:hypothetical protein
VNLATSEIEKQAKSLFRCRFAALFLLRDNNLIASNVPITPSEEAIKVAAAHGVIWSDNKDGSGNIKIPISKDSLSTINVVSTFRSQRVLRGVRDASMSLIYPKNILDHLLSIKHYGWLTCCAFDLVPNGALDKENVPLGVLYIADRISKSYPSFSRNEVNLAHYFCVISSHTIVRCSKYENKNDAILQQLHDECDNLREQIEYSFRIRCMYEFNTLTVSRQKSLDLHRAIMVSAVELLQIDFCRLYVSNPRMLFKNLIFSY